MSRSSRRAGFAVVLLLLVDLAKAAPPFYTPVPLKLPSLPRDTVMLPTSVTRPVLTGITPARCVNPGDSLVINGRNLGQRNARKLIMDTGQQQLPLSIKTWQSTQIIALLPSRFKHRGKVEIGILSVQGWQGTPLPVVICRAAASARTSDQSMPPASPSMPAASTDVPVAPSSNPPPVDTLPPPDNEGLFASPAGTGAGSLIGAALPPVPNALQRVVPDQVSITDTLATIHREYPDLWIDVNHYFRPAAAYRAAGRSG